PVASGDALPLGHELMWYRIEKVLGQGGFGITYKALDGRLDTHVAIKEYLPSQIAARGPDRRVHAKNPDQEAAFVHGRDRFLDEARTLAKFKHSSLVRVATFFEENNTAYMAMEYEEGESLAAILRRKGTLEEKELLEIMVPLLHGIRVLHQAKYIHRDIKPDNIFVRVKDGTPVLLDFGSARKTVEGGDGSLTAMLTPGYAPMEQYFEEANRQGPWTDVYSLGAVMYRCITGRKPLGAPQRSNARMRNQPDPLVPAVEAGQGRYSSSLLQAIDLALRVVETERPQSIDEWLRAVEPEAVASTAEDQAELAAAGKKRTGLLVAAGVGVLVLAGAIIWSLNQGPEAPRVLTAAEQLARDIAALENQVKAGDTTAMLALADQYARGMGVPLDANRALDLERKAAEAGLAEAQYRLGQAFANGHGVPRDAPSALSWLQKAADQGHMLARFEVGQRLAAEADPAARDHGLNMLAEAATQGHARAQSLLAAAFESGQGRPQDDTQALQWYFRAAQQNDMHGLYGAGHLMALGRGTTVDLQRSFELFAAAAEQNHVQAQYETGVRLLEGTGVEANAEKGVMWLTRAARAAHPQAQLELALAYEKGLGTAANQATAIQWFRNAGDAGVLRAQLILAGKYLLGQDVPRDNVEAARWLRLAAAQNDPDALNRLGLMYLSGLGLARDAVAAQELLTRAASLGLADAQNNLGEMFDKGNGVNRDYRQALYWYATAAGQNHTGAQSNLGWMFEEGRGVPKDFKKAAHWYQLAANAGHVRAQNSLAWLYEDGRGVPRDVVRAFAWYSLSAAASDEKAMKNLNILAQDMSADEIRRGKELARDWLMARRSKSHEGTAPAAGQHAPDGTTPR
ncbi:MAG: serine/threonine-protein kinase, partial [Magnetococcus sp. WYHC-3]